MPPIECKLGAAETPVGNETYVFARDKLGRYVAEVSNLKHVQILLSRPSIYAEVRDEALAATALTPLVEDEIEALEEDDFEGHPESPEEEAARLAEEAEAARLTALLGSSILPSTIAITPELEVPLGDVVARAHKDSELSVEAWNTLPEVEREALLVAAIEAMQTEATPSEDEEDAEEEAEETEETEEDTPPVVEPPPPDDLAVLNGIGPSSATKLRNAGVLYIAQLAAFTDAEMAALDAQLGLNGMSARGTWVKVAQDHLAATAGN